MMMNCSEYRRQLLTDPRRPSAEMQAHVAQCQECPQYTERLLRFEGRLEQALQVDIGSSRSDVSGRAPLRDSAGLPLRRRLRVRRRGLALAASVLLAVVGAGLLWLGAPGRSLAAAVVDHMADEPDAWVRTEIAVPARQLDAVMSESGAHLQPAAGLVSYVHSCEFRGHQVPHLVVQTAAGPVTVMVLVHESVRSRVHFDEQGYRGIILPVPGHGSLAVLERAPNTDMKAVDAVAEQVLAALAWSR
jgi:hypothetical protein